MIAGHLWLLFIADSIERAIMSSANDLTSSAAEGTATRDTHCPNETVVTDAKSSKATSRKFQDGGGPSKKRSSSGSHTKPRVSCSLTHRHQTKTRSHPHTSTDQSTSTSSDVPAIFNQFADLMLQMQKRQLETLTSLFPDTSTRANDTDEDSGVSPAKIGRKDSASTSITTPAELSGPAVDPQQPAESLDDLEALVTGDDHASAPPIEEDCALDTEISELERFFQINDSSGATIDEKFLPAINAGLLSTIDHEKIQSVLDRHACPKNIPNLRVPMLNQQIWNILPTSARLSDVKLKYFQLLTTKFITATARCLHLLSSAQGSGPSVDIASILPLVADQLRMGSALYTSLSQRRRDAIKPMLQNEFRQLCQAPNTTSTEFLFGDNFSDEVKSIGESIKLTRTVERQRAPRPQNFSKNGQSRTNPPTFRTANQRGGRQWRSRGARGFRHQSHTYPPANKPARQGNPHH